MPQESVIRRILEAGIQAPSGENAQPWRLAINGDTVSLFNDPESDRSLYNYKQTGSLVAQGTFLENVAIAARAAGCEAKVALFPDKRDPNFVATIEFHETSGGAGAAAGATGDLEPSIARRATNRKPYDASPLSAEEKRELLSGAGAAKENAADARLILLDDRAAIAALAKAASVNETMLIRNKSVHDFFFSHVRWTPEENELQPNGFYIKTLELQPPQEGAFKVLRRWSAAKFAASLGMARVIGGDNKKIYNTASAVVAVVVKSNTPENLVRGGRALERAWLTATKLGLGVRADGRRAFPGGGRRGRSPRKFFREGTRRPCGGAAYFLPDVRR